MEIILGVIVIAVLYVVGKLLLTLIGGGFAYGLEAASKVNWGEVGAWVITIVLIFLIPLIIAGIFSLFT